MVLVTGIFLYYVDPKYTLDNIYASSASSLTIQPTLTYLSQVQNESNGKFYETQFKSDKSHFKEAPELSQATGFVNTVPITFSDLKGKVVLVHFWTYTCKNCINTIPYLNEWYQKYAGEDFEIVGIHTPEFEFEKNLDNVKNAVGKFEIEYPVIQDNNFEIWNAFSNKYWPRDYLIDKEGYIRYNHIGEGDYNQTEMIIQSLMQEPNSNPGFNDTARSIT